MYPFKTDVYAVRNCWYVASFSQDVARQPLERWILDEPVVLYRKEDGEVVALEGRCAHRHFPLGEGKLIGDNLQCPYHGITYGPDGTSVNIPSQSSTKAHITCQIKSFPTVEMWRWVWIWMGDPELADPALIPNHKDMGLTDPEFVATEVCHHELEARHQLVHDNLLDLSHVAFLHRDTLGGGSDDAAVSDFQRSDGPNWVRSDLLINKTKIPSHFEKFLGASGECTRYMPMFFFMPALHVGMDDYRRISHEPGALGESLGKLLVHHAVTPARRNTCHYFFATARNFGQEASEQMVAAFNAVIDEDVYGVEGVERMLREYGDRLPGDFIAEADRHQVMTRRKMEAQIKADLEGVCPADMPRLELKSAGDRLLAENHVDLLLE